jgi:Tfp pilus assembly protein PilF
MSRRHVEVVIALCLIGCFGSYSRAGVAGECEQPVGHLVSIQGAVEVRQEPSGEWHWASLNEPLCEGTVMRVGDRSRAEVALIDQSKYRIDQNSTLRLVQVRKNAPSLMNLIAGVAYFFSRQPRVLQIDTPFVNAAVEGTEFLLNVDDVQTLLTVFEGKVVASNERGRLPVAGGEAALTRVGEAPQPELLVHPRNAVQWALYYPFVLLPLAASGAAVQGPSEPLASAIALAGRGEFAAAFARFDAIPDAERSADFYVYRAGTLLAVGRVGEADADVTRALARDPSAGLAYALRAVIAVVQDDNLRALADARRAVELAPRSAAAKIALSYAEQARFHIAEARDVLKRAVEDEPNNALGWARLSEVWLMLGYRDRALKAAEKAQAQAPELARTHTVLGFAALAGFDTERAKNEFYRAIATDSANPQPRLGLGLAEIRDGRLKEGRNEIEIAVALDPNNSLLRSYLGKAFFEEKRDRLASEQYAEAEKLDPNDPTPWFYDAILKETQNRPVEALNDLQKSIALNDDRAVYRSRELLDADRAARGASLGRIYNDLGFEQAGINEATRSLGFDPSNAAAHRFLSDVYAPQPRREIARVSELLQAQLLQDININPVQPSLGATNLNIITQGGPVRPGFNEYNTLFERNQAQLNLSGVVGSNATRGEEAVVSGIYDRFSLSAGQFHYHSDGFRENFDNGHDIYDVYAQAAVTPDVNVQGEFRHRTTEFGDLFLNYDPDSFSGLTRSDVAEQTTRLGARVDLSPSTKVVGSLIYNKLNDNLQDDPDTTFISKNEGIQGEVAAYIADIGPANFVAGSGASRVDSRQRSRFNDVEAPSDQTDHFDYTYTSGYLYSNVRYPKDVTWTIGFSYDNLQESHLQQNVDLDRQMFDPKLGLIWDLTPFFRIRAAAFRTLNPPLVANRTVQPTQVAGFNQFYDDANGTEAWNYGAGLDVRLNIGAYGGFEFVRRDLNEPVVTSKTILENRQETTYRTYLYWALTPEWVVTGEGRLDLYSGKEQPGSDIPTHVDTWSASLGLRYFHPLGFFASVLATPAYQQVERKAGPSNEDGDNSFVVVDAALGYRLPQRFGVLSFQARNLTNQHFKYQDDSFREFRGTPSISPFVPERAFFGQLTLNF